MRISDWSSDVCSSDLRLAVRLAGQAHDAAHALGEVVVAGARRVGSRLAEAGDRAVDEAGMALLQVVVAEPVAREVPDLVVLDQDVAVADQLGRQLLALGLGDVDADGALVAVGGEIGRASWRERGCQYV